MQINYARMPAMPEFRQNPTTKEWVIISTERAKRPENFPQKIQIPEDQNALDNCPFCEGNESKTPPEIIAYRAYGTKPNDKGWWIRVVPNMFPALLPSSSLEREEIDGFFRHMDGFGKHEVIIEHPQHNFTIATMEEKQVEEIFLAYRERYIALSLDSRFEMVLIFRNHGQGAGTSVRHPHSQIIATPITPSHLRHRLEESMRYFDDTGKCLYCKMLEEELKIKDRLVVSTDNFVAFELFASRSPFETLILPKKHASSFSSITKEDSKELAYITRIVLKKIFISLKDPDFNYVINSSPPHENTTDHYHWHMHIIPRITAVAGFEVGSGIFINTVIPENAAKFLRETETS